MSRAHWLELMNSRISERFCLKKRKCPELCSLVSDQHMHTCPTYLHEAKPVEDGLSIGKNQWTAGLCRTSLNSCSLQILFSLFILVTLQVDFSLALSVTHAIAAIFPRNSALSSIFSS